MLICLSAFLGLTGGRQACSYLFLTDIVPMTHISFVSMWFSGSLALAVLVQTAYFFFIPHWKYFLIFNIGVGVIITFAGSYLLVESPMHLLIHGNTLKANKSIERIKKFNNLGTSRQIQLYDLSHKIR